MSKVGPKKYEHSEEAKRKIALAQTGEKNSFYGKKHSLKTRIKMGKNHKNQIAENNPNWRGGKIKINGYIKILNPEHPHAEKNGYVLRSRLVMEKHLGRYLNPKELVHHKNGNISDDKIENLGLFPSQGKHTAFHNKLRTTRIKGDVICL